MTCVTSSLCAASGTTEAHVPIATIGLLSVFLFFSILPGEARPATPFNVRSSIGINLSAVTYYASEQPFINSFVTSEGWITHSNTTWDTKEEKYIKLDQNGWPTTLNSVNEPTAQQFSSVGVLFFVGMPDTGSGNYPAGQYVVTYDGQGTLSYGLDAALLRRSPGRDIINVSPSSKGIDLRIVATDPHHTGNYLRNIRVVTAANEAAARGGQIFNPVFLELIRNFRALRFMDWFQTNGSTLSSWAERPMPTYAYFGTSKGVPLEVAVQLANEVSADAWMNVPVTADDNFIRQMATLVHNQLGSTQKIYVELSNEVWNSSFSQFEYASSQGKALWRVPTRSFWRSLWPFRSSDPGDFEYNREWFGMRTAQMCDIWRSVWRSDPRLVCVLGAQAAWSFSAIEALKCPYWTEGAPCSGHAIDAVAVAPYMGGAVPSAWTSQPDGGLANLFRSLYSRIDPSVPVGGFIAQDAEWLKDLISNLAPYKLPLLAYEGGQTFANGSTDALNNLYIAANRDPRMGQAYTRYLQQWKAGGGQLFMHYNDVGVGSKYGSWGAIESIMQSTTPLSAAPPKWQAIQNFLSQNPCWWPSCAGVVAGGRTGSSPIAQANRHVQ